MEGSEDTGNTHWTVAIITIVIIIRRVDRMPWVQEKGLKTREESYKWEVEEHFQVLANVLCLFVCLSSNLSDAQYLPFGDKDIVTFALLSNLMREQKRC